MLAVPAVAAAARAMMAVIASMPVRADVSKAHTEYSDSMSPYRYTRASSCVHNCSSVQLVHGSFSITCSLLCFHLHANGHSSTLSKRLRENTESVNAALQLECSISFEDGHNEAHTILHEL
jgi:hypothetical protein